MTQNIVTPNLLLTITTYELRGDKLVATLTHTFHGDTQEELFAIMNAHKQTDAFFRASFTGKFEWKGGVIYLINSEPFVSYP